MGLQDDFSPESLRHKAGTRLSALANGRLAPLFNLHAQPILPNGLRLQYDTDHRSDTITLKLQVRAGARHDPPGKEGLAHMLEHMIASQNKDVIRNITQEIYRRGGSAHATTGDLDTAYEFYLPRSAENEKNLYEAVRRMVFRPEFDPAQLEEEKKVVIGEYKRGHDQDVDNLEARLIETGFGRKHRFVLGTEESIKNISVDDLKKFHADYYCARNMDMEIKGVPLFSQSWAQLKRIFSDVHSGEEAQDPPSGYRYKGGHTHMEAPTEISYAVAGIPLGQNMTPQQCAVSDCLCAYANMVLKNHVRGEEGRMGYHADSHIRFFERQTVLTLKTEVLPEYKEAALRAMGSTIADIAQGKIDQDAFESARRGILRYLRDTERQMAVDHYALDYKNPDKTVGMMRHNQKLLDSVTPEDLAAMVKKGVERLPTLVTRGAEEIPGAYADFCAMLGAPSAQNRPEADPGVEKSRHPAQGQALQG